MLEWLKHSQIACLRSPWDDDHKEEDDEMNLFESGGGDSKMSSPSASKAVSGPPAFPPKPVTPTRGAGKGKQTSTAVELTPHGPCTGLLFFIFFNIKNLYPGA
jgi:hypothetical protein